MTLHPLFEAAIGRDVDVTYRGPQPGRIVVDGRTVVDNVVRFASGRLGIVVSRDEVLTDLVVETDGGATVIPVTLVLSLKECAS